MQMIKVFDLENQERDFEYARAKYGVAFRRAEVGPGQRVYRLVELWEKTGHHSLITQVLNEDSYPIECQGVAFHWPDAPDPPDPPVSVEPHDWYRNFVHGLTNVNGDVGPGMGGGAWIDVDPNPPHNAIDGGPHAVWVRDPDIPSDICEKLGMRGGTNHDHLDQVFQLKIEGGQEPMPEGKFVEDTFERRFDRTEGTNHIGIHLDEKSTRDFHDTRVDLRCGSWEAEPISPVTLYNFNIHIGAYTPSPGETDRTYQVAIRHAGTEEMLSDWLEFKFETDVPGIHHAYVEWQTGDEPTPPPPPPVPPEPPPDLAALVAVLQEIRDALREIASSRLLKL